MISLLVKVWHQLGELFKLPFFLDTFIFFPHAMSPRDWLFSLDEWFWFMKFSMMSFLRPCFSHLHNIFIVKKIYKVFLPGGILFLLSVIFLNHHTYQKEKSLLICLPSAKINGYIFEWTWNRFCLFFFTFNNIFVSTFKQKQL